LSASTKELRAAYASLALLETGHALSLQQPRAIVDPLSGGGGGEWTDSKAYAGAQQASGEMLLVLYIDCRNMTCSTKRLT